MTYLSIHRLLLLSPGDDTQQPSSQNSDMTYYTASTTSGTPSHRTTTAPNTLTPSSFISYLKQPGVMLTSINASDLATGAHPSGDFHNMPDLLTQNMSTGNVTVKTTKDLRLFKCDTCGRAFRQKSTLLQHERIHTDTRPYPCNECGKRFRQQSHLIQHIRIHANEKPYNCMYCARSFRQRAILDQHVRAHLHSGATLTGNGALYLYFSIAMSTLVRFSIHYVANVKLKI